jgi:hypothetical protein
MQEHEARVRAFYDHEVEETRTGRRRRQVADWGVGEDVFDRMPSRRFSRGAERPHARRAPEVPDPREHRAEPWAAREPRLAAEPDAAIDELWLENTRRPAGSAPGTSPRRVDSQPPPDDAGGEDFAEGAPAGGRQPSPRPGATGAVPRGRRDDGRRTIVIGEPHDEDVSATDGRRTVVIGSRSAPTGRRRPPRSGAERVGPRPDRIVAYVVALGLLLIMIAILSAGH